MWTLVIERAWYFRARAAAAGAGRRSRSWQARTDHRSWCARQIRQTLISRVELRDDGGPARCCARWCRSSPLLGLIGTVSGMLEVFDSMALRGSADARAMASGVSHAMICTLTGLAVSITGLYPNYYFQSRARVETELLADKLVY